MKYSALWGAPLSRSVSIVMQHVWSGGDAPLSKLTYLDQSGQFYEHGGVAKQTGELIGVRVQADKNTSANFTGIVSNRSASALCTEFGGELPCGFGVGTLSSERYASQALSVRHQFKGVTVTAKEESSVDTSLEDYSSETIAGIPSPAVFTDGTLSRQMSLDASFKIGRHAMTATLDDSAVRDVVTGYATAPGASPASYERLVDFAVTDSTMIGRNATLKAAIHYARISSVRPTWMGDVSTDFKVSAADTLRTSVGAGSAQAQFQGTIPFSDPAHVEFVCNGATYLHGPGDADQAQRDTRYSLGWSHRGSQATVDVRASLDVQGGQLFTASVPISAEPSGYFPPGYVAAVTNAWGQVGQCAGTAFGRSQVYVLEPIGGSVRRYQSLSVSTKRRLGVDVVAAASLSLQSATLLSDDPRFQSPYSQLAPGFQLLSRPHVRGSVSLDFLHSPRSVEWMVLGQYTGSNNARRLGAFGTLAVGLRKPLGHGSVTIVNTNLLHEDVGLYATTSLSQAVPLRGGGSISRLAFPLEPGQLRVSYSLGR